MLTKIDIIGGVILELFIQFLFYRRTTCLKYLVLANMLMKSGINPFDSQEVFLIYSYGVCVK